MSNFMQIQGAGQLGADPEIKTSKAGKEFVQFTLAVNKDFLDKADNVWKHTVHWYDFVSFNHVKAIARLKKGDAVMVNGAPKVSAKGKVTFVAEHVAKVAADKRVKVDQVSSTEAAV